MSTKIWCADFSDPTVSDVDKAIFIHEFMHVWQYYHGVTKLSALWLFVRYGGDYDPLAYRYDLSHSNDLLDYNIEQQASIIEDWWRIKKTSLGPQHNIGTVTGLSAYHRYMDQVWSAGLDGTWDFSGGPVR